MEGIIKKNDALFSGGGLEYESDVQVPIGEQK